MGVKTSEPLHGEGRLSRRGRKYPRTRESPKQKARDCTTSTTSSVLATRRTPLLHGLALGMFYRRMPTLSYRPLFESQELSNLCWGCFLGRRLKRLQRQTISSTPGRSAVARSPRTRSTTFPVSKVQGESKGDTFQVPEKRRTYHEFKQSPSLGPRSFQWEHPGRPSVGRTRSEPREVTSPSEQRHGVDFEICGPDSAPGLADAGRKSPRATLSTFSRLTFNTPSVFRRLHTSSRISHEQNEQVAESPPGDKGTVKFQGLKSQVANSHIRSRLREWQESQDGENLFLELLKEPPSAPSVEPFTSTGRDDKATEEEEEAEKLDMLTALSEEDDQYSSSSAGLEFLKPGDLVQLAGEVGELAVFVRVLNTESQFYTVSGRWLHSRASRAQYVVPDFINSELLDALIPYLPDQEVPFEAQHMLKALDTGVPRQMGAPIIRKIAQFRDSADSFYRKHAAILDSAHDCLADVKLPKFLYLDDVAGTLLGNEVDQDDPAVVLYTIHMSLARTGSGFRLDGGLHRKTKRFTVLSKNQISDTDTFSQWARAQKEEEVGAVEQVSTRSPKASRDGSQRSVSPFMSFVAKAKKIIGNSRRTRSITNQGTVGPYKNGQKSSKEPSDEGYKSVKGREMFSPNDRIIIRALEQLCARRLYRNDHPLHSSAAFLLHATGAYQDQPLNAGTLFTFLQEIGVFAPWEQMPSFSYDVGLPSYVDFSPRAKAIAEYAKYNEDGMETLKDSMSEFRKDWKDLEIFCFDSEDTTEIDDGISLERIPESKDIFWIHIHVAHPSAFISPQHDLASTAGSLYRTLYLPGGALSMLPQALTQAQLGLGSDRPALTFSAKINLDGEIIETQVGPSIIRKVTYMTPSRLDAILGGGKEDQPSGYTVGKEIPGKPKSGHSRSETLSSSQIDDINVLRKISDKLRRGRAAQGGMIGLLPQPSLSIHKGSSATIFDDTPIYRTTRFFNGDPSIRLLESHLDLDSTSRGNITSNMVSEIMILAGKVAAEWCDARNISAPYRGGIMNVGKTHLHKAQRAAVLANMHEDGFIPPRLVLGMANSHEATVMSANAIPHTRMGVAKYVQATSPLRRYVDLLTHWQIDAAWAHEARTGQSLIGLQDESLLPFSRAAMSDLVPQLWQQEKALRVYSTASDYFWICQFFDRAHNFKEVKLPETFEFCVARVVTREGVVVALGWISMFSVKALMSIPSWVSGSDLTMGDRFEARIEEVRTYPMTLLLSPLKIIHKED